MTNLSSEIDKKIDAYMYYSMPQEMLRAFYVRNKMGFLRIVQLQLLNQLRHELWSK